MSQAVKPKTIATGTVEVFSDNSVKLTIGQHIAHGKPYSTYSRDNSTDLSHGIRFVVDENCTTLKGIKVERPVPQTTSEEFQNAARTAPAPDKDVIAAMVPKLQALRAQPHAFRSLDVKNQVAVPADRRERMVIYDGLPANLRQVFVDACEMADKVARSRK